MNSTLQTMDIIMPLEIWGMAIGVILSYIAFAIFLRIIERPDKPMDFTEINKANKEMIDLLNK